jgi:hypothetical protein
MSITTRVRRGLATALAGALATGALVALAGAPAQAAPKTVAGVELTWSLSNEQGGGAFFGGCNFLSAGTAGDTGSSRLWTEADGFYKAVDGNVSIEKPTSAGDYVAPTWSTKCLTPAGVPASAASTASTTGNRVKLSAGSGTVDAETGAGTIAWSGSFTSAFYGGMTYWSATDPKLTIDADGTGTLTATASGYGSDMVDTGKWVPLTPRTITLAEFADADLTLSGLTATPTYLGNAITASGTPQPAKTDANAAYWGAFPQSFVDFQIETGQSSYWYTSGGSRDAAKPATAVKVTIAPKVTVTKTSFLPDGTQNVTVTGTGFDPSLATGTRPPLMNSQSGAYIAVGKFAASWRPSEGVPSSSRKTMTTAQGGLKWAVPEASLPAIGGAAGGGVVLSPDGSFTATLNVDKAQLDAIATDPSLVNYGIYTYPGSGGVSAAYETYTPITFDKAQSSLTVAGSSSSYGTASTVTATVANAAGLPTDGTVTLTGSGIDLTAAVANGSVSFALPATLKAGTFGLTATYSGNANVAASTSTGTATVRKAVVKVKRGSIKKPTTKRSGKTSLTLTSTATVTGTVKVTFTKKGQKTKTKTVTIRNGKGNVTIPKLKKGTWKISVKYAGTANFAATATKSLGSVKVSK